MKRVIVCSSVNFLILFTSCHFINNKVEDLADKTEQKVKSKTEQLADKVIPVFDSEIPDTKFNQIRFTEFLKVDLTLDIKNIYCFDDAIGADADYQFAFNCNFETAKRIIEKHQLILDPKITDYGFSMQHDFPWWDKKKIEILQLYAWKGEHEFYKYFWYDKKEQKAYYFEFDM
jgi:predicted double-glycine peptidase